jgi:hypothetical protein
MILLKRLLRKPSVNDANSGGCFILGMKIFLKMNPVPATFSVAVLQ